MTESFERVTITYLQATIFLNIYMKTRTGFSMKNSPYNEVFKQVFYSQIYQKL